LVSIVGRYGQGVAGEVFLQGNEFGALGGSEETVVANLHKVVRQDMLEEALDEFFGGEGAVLELTIVGGAVGEGNLGRGYVAGVDATDQAAIAEGDTVNVGSQILECRLSIAHWLAVHTSLWSRPVGSVQRTVFCKRDEAVRNNLDKALTGGKSCDELEPGCPSEAKPPAGVR
jgi:hypothetical protein